MGACAVGLLTIMKELNVGKVIICEQGKDSENYQEFKNIVRKKKIKVNVIKKRRWDSNWKRLKNSDFMANGKTNTRKHF